MHFKATEILTIFKLFSCFLTTLDNFAINVNGKVTASNHNAGRRVETLKPRSFHPPFRSFSMDSPLFGILMDGR